MPSANSKYRHLTAGEAAILEIIDENPEMRGWVESLRDSPFEQCETCQMLTFKSLKSFYGGQMFRANWDQVKDTAVKGCHTCRVLYFAYMGAKIEDSGLVRTAPRPIELCLTWARLEAGYWGNQFIFCKTGFMPDVPLDDCEKELNKIITTRFIEDDPGSDGAFALAESWILDCVASHDHCLNNQNVELPSRVLDIGEYITTGRAYLFISGGVKSTYVALSHCWGGDAPEDGLIRECTTKNYKELRAGFFVSRLPRTFQEAILVANQLGVRYLWIDSLCILQDSHSDWSHESELMSRVYGNSYVTIYASAAPNSDAGFLRCRPRDRRVRTKLCRVPDSLDRWIWIQWPGGEQVWNLDESAGPLWSRGWAFQELVLPPRVLEYGPHAMSLRCNTQHYEEDSRRNTGGTHDGYKELLWIMSLPDIINSPSLEHNSFSRDPGGTTMTVYRRWYNLVEGFAGRELTEETDKLPAIAGIADKIRQITGDSYMAGLWKNDIATGLCWGVGTRRLPSKYIAPSWSWASTIGTVRYPIPDDLKFSVELVDWKIEADPLNPLGEVSHGFITIGALMRPFDISGDNVHTQEDYDHEAQKVRVNLKRTRDRSNFRYSPLKFPLSDQEEVRDPRAGGTCAMWFDVEPTEDLKEVLLVDLKAESYNMKLERPSGSFKPEGIILQSAMTERFEATGTAVYKRIGLWGRSDAWAEWLEEGEESAVLEGWKQTDITII
ncbi:HET-domain-containing protein [Lindgomyces ingoldianus]|uniref:HET-domain-containing protein n=1 Tax=Lindgomyces ingoldianus TaxID=673940 RepID=A0ACB6QUT6_9PLEO|nr:HET-domain-containing protein [Lindgomyces ingoldianus]KAF2470809.1 HET-domain-containing protein [Lindgomyces ingoldianus]